MNFRVLAFALAIGGAYAFQEMNEFKLKKSFKQKNAKYESHLVLTPKEGEQNKESLNAIRGILEGIWHCSFQWVQPETSLSQLKFKDWSLKKQRQFSRAIERHWDVELPHISDLREMKISQILNRIDYTEES